MVEAHLRSDLAAHVLLVEDDPLQQRMLARALKRAGLRVHVAAALQPALCEARRLADELTHALVDLSIPETEPRDIQTVPPLNGLSLIQELRALRPEMRIVASSGFADPRRADLARSLGADRFLAKPASPGEILAALRGDPPKITDSDLNPLFHLPTQAAERFSQRCARPPLTGRQLEVLKLVAMRKSNTEIAEILGCANQTVRHHIVEILNRTGLHSRMELIRETEAAQALHKGRGWIDRP